MNFPINLRLCRLCLLHKDSFVNIHEPNDRYGFVVVDEINELLQLNITPGDGLPEGICYDCLYDLSHFKRFKKVSQEAEITLKYILSHNGENGHTRGKSADELDYETNGYGSQEVGTLMDTHPTNSHSLNLRRDPDMHSMDGEDAAEETDVALMCEATLSEVDDTLPLDDGVDVVRRSIKVERDAHSSQRRDISNNVFSLVREQVKTKRMQKNEAKNRQNPIPIDISTINAQNSYKCSDCLVVFPDEYSFKSHISISHCEVDDTLPLDGGVHVVRRSIKVERDAHSSQRRDISNNVVSMVREQAKTKKMLKNEAKNRLNPIPIDISAINAQNCYKCSDCLTVFPDEYTFRSHVSSSECAPLYVCSICNESFMNNTCLMEHNLNYHAGESQECNTKDPNIALTMKRGFVCDECGTCFKKKMVFEHHMLQHHAQVLSFKCKVCWKGFLTKGGLKEHLVVHSTERPFVCEICGSAFKLRKKLLRHVRNCHSEKWSGGTGKTEISSAIQL